jgi:hypothetical protein
MEAKTFPRHIGSPESIPQHQGDKTFYQFTQQNTANQTEQRIRNQLTQLILHVISPTMPALLDVWQRCKSNLV